MKVGGHTCESSNFYDQRVAAQGAHISLQMASSRSECTRLFSAVAAGDLDQVKLLADAGLRLRFRDRAGNTLLLAAAAAGHLSVLRWLAGREAPDWEERNHRWETPLMVAALAGHLALCEWMVSQGASLVVRDDGSLSLLNLAAGSGHLPVVRWLVQKDPSGVDEIGPSDEVTAFQLAAGRGHLDVAGWLAAQGANVAARTPDGETALHFAAEMGRQRWSVGW